MANFLLYLRSAAPIAGKLMTHDATLWPQGYTLPMNPKVVVNCSDCGTLTKAFANVLGSELKLVRIQQSHRCNEIKPIGRAWAVPFGYGFGYHAFSAVGAVGSEEIYDACLEVGRPAPTIPWTRTGGKLPTGMTFDIANAAGHGGITLTKAGGSSTANGTLVVVSVDEHSTMNNSITVECTAVNAAGTTFTATSASGRSGTGTGKVGLAAGDFKEIQMTQNDSK